MNTPRWYMVNKMGMATLCTSKKDAEKEARAMDMAWPHMGPHRAVQLVEAADAQQETFDHGPQATSIEEAARDVGKWLNERPNRPLDLRHVAMLSAHAQAAQEAQEPVAWYVTGGSRLLDEDEAKAEARHIGGTARAMPLYTVPQPSPASQGDALDAARLDWLESQSQVNIERVRYLGADTTIYEVTSFNSTDYNGETLRKAIDAARAAHQKGETP